MQFAIERAKCTVARRSRPGFTLIELILTLTLLSLLTSIATPRLRAALDMARTARAIGEIRVLQQEITERAISSSLPATLADIGRGGMLDPWGRPYVYLRFPPCTAGTGFSGGAGGTGGSGGSGGAGAGGGGGSGCGVPVGARMDRFLVPLNSDYDLYSVGPDGSSQPPLTVNVSKDDVLRANDGGFIGVAANY